MIDALIRNLQADISLLQTFINRRQAARFYDMERMLEALTIHVFRALSLGELKNLNQLRTNFPAIDLADDARGVAVQVTSNASVAKIRKTIEKFEKLDATGQSIRARYQKLFIFGFCKLTKTPVPQYCELMSADTMIERLVEDADEDSILNIIEAVHRHQSYSSLHPWNDKDSLEIILNLINRNAIKHRMSCEGSLANMTTGLNEISELIGKGTVNRREKSKSINDFTDNQMKSYLRKVMNDVSGILAIVHRSGQKGYVDIDQTGMQQIDRLKKKIADDTSTIALRYDIDIRVTTLGD